jgi:hypothetical protein
MRVLAVDPGGNTGIAWYDSEGEEHEAFILPFGADQDWIADNIWLADFVVCEDFIISAGTLRKGQDGSKMALETIGVLRYLARVHGKAFTLQAPADARTFDQDWSKLKKLGWYTPGPDHARSASRHLLVACLKLGVVSPDLLVG